MALEKSGQASVERNRSTPKKRKPSGLKDDDVLTFGPMQISLG